MHHAQLYQQFFGRYNDSLDCNESFYCHQAILKIVIKQYSKNHIVIKQYLKTLNPTE